MLLKYDFLCNAFARAILIKAILREKMGMMRLKIKVFPPSMTTER